MINPIVVCTNRETVALRIRTYSSPDESGCWIWQRAIDRWGYGATKVQTPDGLRSTGAHRAAWLALVGNIPSESLQIDHLCRTRSCVNPEHMELVTNAENTLRSDHSGKRGRSGRRAGSPPGCSKHGLENGRYSVAADGYKRWNCQTCATARVRKFLDAKYAARAVAKDAA